jgi:hypothetical protein
MLHGLEWYVATGVIALLTGIECLSQFSLRSRKTRSLIKAWCWQQSWRMSRIAKVVQQLVFCASKKSVCIYIYIWSLALVHSWNESRITWLTTISFRHLGSVTLPVYSWSYHPVARRLGGEEFWRLLATPFEALQFARRVFHYRRQKCTQPIPGQCE